MNTLFHFLLSLVLGASFQSAESGGEKVGPPFDYSQITPKDELIEKLSKVAGIPTFDERCTPAKWMLDVYNNGYLITESIARWFMLRHPHQFFFDYAVDTLGYADILVKDIVDYHDWSKEPPLILISYLNKHGLSHFRYSHLPDFLLFKASRANDVGECRHLIPLLSDYSKNHPAILKNQLLPTTDTVSALVFEISLICYCLGGVELKELPAPKNLLDRYIMIQVSREFPREMKALLETPVPAYQFDHEASIELWKHQVSSFNWNADKKSSPFFLIDHSFCQLIHHLFQSHQKWLDEHFLELTPAARLVYFENYFSDFNPEALPQELPPFEAMVPLRCNPNSIPFLEALIAKYGRDAIIKSAQKDGSINRIKMAARFTLTLKINEPQHLHRLLNTSFNKFYTVLYYRLRDAFDDDEVASWLHHIFIEAEKTWLLPLLLLNNNDNGTN